MSVAVHSQEIMAEAPVVTPDGQRFLDYWRGLQPAAAARAGASARRPLLPAKSDFDPTGIAPLLPQVVLYERRAPDDFHIRLMGTAVVERIGREATGCNVLDLVAPAARGLIAEILGQVLETPCGHVSLVEDVYPNGRRQRIEVVRLPLLDGAGQIRFIVSLTQPLDIVGYTKRAEHPTLLAAPVESRFFAL